MDQSGVNQRDGSSAISSVSGEEEKLSTMSRDDSSGSSSSEADILARLRAVKFAAIRRACDLRDLDALVSHATSEGGLLDDELRQMACGFLWVCVLRTRLTDLAEQGQSY